MRTVFKNLLWSFVTLFAPSGFTLVSAGELTGYLSLESRVFWENRLHDNQPNASLSAATELEYYKDWDNDNQRFVVSGFARADSHDSERSHLDLRELYWRRSFDTLELYIGVRQLFWGVTESVHLVDIINQDDALEDLDGEDKLGQPMISLLSQQDWGTLEVFVMPGFRERSLPGHKGRFRTPVVFDKDRVTYQSKDEENHIDFAIRWSQVLGDWDLALSHFSGTGRDPVLQPVMDGADNQIVALAPYYPLIEQTGLDLQVTKEAWLWKLEAISLKERQAERSAALVGGLEYTFFGINYSSADLGILLEYQFDNRSGNRQPISQNDLALGVRWALNDYQSTELLAVASLDLDWGTRFFSVEGSRRINDHWSIQAGLRVFSHVDKEDPLFAFRHDDYLQLELIRYF